jgi:hypothetical protein
MSLRIKSIDRHKNADAALTKTRGFIPRKSSISGFCYEENIAETAKNSSKRIENMAFNKENNKKG